MVCSHRLLEDRHAGGRRRQVAALASIVVAVLALPAGAGTLAVKDNLYGVKAMSASEAWAVGNFGSIYHTADAGKTWEARDSGTKVPLFGIDFADAEHGWIVGKSSTILATADGGKTWKPEKSVIPPEKHLFNLKAIDARTVWVVGDWGAIATTHDGGATWEDRSLADDVVLYAVSFPDPQHGFIAGEFGTLLATADGGRTWEKRPVGTEKTLFGVSFATPEKGWAVGIDGLILRTRDAGQTWEVQHGALAIDGGETWTARELPEKQRLVWLRGVSLLPDGSAGFAVGAGGFMAAIDHGQIVLPANGRRAAAGL